MHCVSRGAGHGDRRHGENSQRDYFGARGVVVCLASSTSSALSGALTSTVFGKTARRIGSSRLAKVTLGLQEGVKFLHAMQQEFRPSVINEPRAETLKRILGRRTSALEGRQRRRALQKDLLP